MKERLTKFSLDGDGNLLNPDDWPAPKPIYDSTCGDHAIGGSPESKEITRWRLQILLASHPMGIPSLAFAGAYRQKFQRPLDARELGFELISEMFTQMQDVFAIQQPDELTKALFPDYPGDTVLHDARLGLEFSSRLNSTNGHLHHHHHHDTNTTSVDPLSQSCNSLCNSASYDSLSAAIAGIGISRSSSTHQFGGGQQATANTNNLVAYPSSSSFSPTESHHNSTSSINNNTANLSHLQQLIRSKAAARRGASVSANAGATSTQANETGTGSINGEASARRNYEQLIHRAWINRDEEFPDDVVLAGETYDELLIISSASIPGTRGLYQGTLSSVASPDSVFIQLKINNEQVRQKIQALPQDVASYFEQTKLPREAYRVPMEFMFTGFPCLVCIVSQGRNLWERCLIAARSKTSGKVLVESVDFGGWYAVDQAHLYLMPRKFLDVPRHTFEISLAGLKPTVKIEDANSNANANQDNNNDNNNNSNSKGATSRYEWSNNLGSRMRCFSYQDYWLDILLMDRKPKTRSSVYQCSGSTSEQSSPLGQTNLSIGGQPEVTEPSQNDNGTTDATRSNMPGADAVDARKKADKMRCSFKGSPKFDAIIVDRNDQDIDIYLDEILVLETYAQFDENRQSEMESTKLNLKEALANLPRPQNPFYTEKYDRK